MTTTVVLVHGAFHGPWCWEQVCAGLDARGIPNVAPELPFTGLDTDADAVRAVLDVLDGPAVVCGHSYGGMVISQATSGRTDVQRLVYLCAVQVADDGQMSEYFADRPTPFMETLRPDDTGLFLEPEAAGECFYHDCDPDTAAAAVARLRRMNAGPGALSSPDVEKLPAAWLTIPSTYVVCSGDRVLHPDAQRDMARNASDSVEWPTSHSPMLSRPELVVDLLAELATSSTADVGSL
jgi:pimeloyl-ACP methyl ester carboxylesterase